MIKTIWGKTMETTAKYAYEVYKKGSFTKAAKNLFISQPSLSAAISKLENELGFRIFDRSTVPCSLTPQGKIYIESIEEIFEVENKMRKKIKDCSNNSSLTVGGSSFASYLLLTKICSGFFENYPEIDVTLDIGNIGSSLSLMEKLERNELDILVTYANNHPNVCFEPICEERLIVAMHKNMPGAEKLGRFAITRDEILENRYSVDREIEDMSIFSTTEFLEFPIKSDANQRMSKILGNYRSSRYKIENARHSEMHYNLMCAGIGAVLTSSLTLAQKPFDENILFFIPKCEESYRKIYLAYNSLSKNNKLVKNFIKVAKDIYSAK